MPPAAALLDEMVEEVFLRFPPDEPKHLLRAALVCKRWRRIVSDRGFRRRFCELHRKPRMLGFLYNRSHSSIFVPTCSFRPPSAAHRYGPVIDARHGRVLLLPGFPDWEKRPLDNAFVVWDPITSERRELPLLPRSVRSADWNAAVLCATAPGGACDHLDCCGGPFLVIFVATDKGRMFDYAYSSETGAWSEQTSAQHAAGCRMALSPSALVGNALYFLNGYLKTVLKFDLGTRKLSVIRIPPSCYFGSIVLMITEHGGLGFATVVNSELHLWSRESGSEEDAGWVQSRVIELKTLFPAHILDSLYVTGFGEGVDIIFVRGNRKDFTIDLKSIQVTKVQKDIGIRLAHMFPYTGLYTPGENSLQRALLRAEVIVDEAMGRHIKNQAMLQQLDVRYETPCIEATTLDTFRYQYHDEKEAKDKAVVYVQNKFC
ncbi:hypothetical protein PR202_ga28591 [Eleusine coracana subsp. coracana]|uniref:F-box domain-containing protein n=1 Tax=Eleusine coracana subsp. coracana TaxID=191504 RepID=A0AAV5DJM8_ELECO|nr:hypothetical protein PR202_ga28591 [Eleusine coracana subsp. coracana]